MRHEVTIHELGEGVEEAQFAAWLEEPGAVVEADTPIAEVMTDKVNVEIVAPVAGVLVEQRCAEDDMVALGQCIAVIETD